MVSTEITLKLPRWYALAKGCGTIMRGSVVAVSGKAVHFVGRIITGQSTTCVLCGRELTNPVSYILGIGPICAEKLGISRQEYEELSPEEIRHLIESKTFDLWIPRSVLPEEVLQELGLRNEGPEPPPTEPEAPSDSIFLPPSRQPEPPAPAPTLKRRLPDRVERVFTETFRNEMKGYEPREPQIQMARMVAEGLETGEHVCAEAGTGTGKSFALLVPAILYAQDVGKPVIISTGTIALQEQYTRKDIPFLQRILDTPFRAALAKGKGNYLCLLRLDKEIEQASLLGETELLKWARETKTGDKSELSFDPPAADWQRINADDSCIGQKCPAYERCHYYRAKRELGTVDIVICNHHLFMADLAIRMGTDGMGGVLPPAAAVMFDEAHHLEGIARESLGSHVTNFKVVHWLREVKKLPILLGQELTDKELDLVSQRNETLFTLMAQAMGKETRIAIDDLPQGQLDLLRRSVDDLETALNLVIAQVSRQASSFNSEDRERWNKLRDQVGWVIPVLRQAIDKTSRLAGDENTVYWAERDNLRSGLKVTLHATPIEVDELLREHLFGEYPSVALTSATIAVRRSFDHLKERLGVPAARELVVDSPFDYRAHCLLYVPRPERLPDPKAPDFHERIVPEIEELLLKTDGRAFVLFTSYRGMQTVYDRLKDRLRWQVMKQGDAPRSVLLERFKEDTHSVLFATATFWEGVDVQGESLSCVIIDKLPFPVPSDPVTRAITAAVEARGKSAFYELSLPEAVIRVKQGFGRLIRTKNDRGLVAILDHRIRSKPYGRAFLDSLPPARRIESLENVEAFLATAKEESAS